MPVADSINGKKVLLRPIADCDTENIVRWRNSDAVRRYFLDRREITPESHRKWLEKITEGTVAQFIIVDRESGTDVGSCFLRDIDRQSKKAELGIFLGEESVRGKGLGSDAASTLTRYALEEMGLNKVFLRVLKSNSRAVSAYKNAGFSLDGVLREDYLDGNKFEDVCLMSALKNEYLESAQ